MSPIWASACLRVGDQRDIYVRMPHTTLDACVRSAIRPRWAGRGGGYSLNTIACLMRSLQDDRGRV